MIHYAVAACFDIWGRKTTSTLCGGSGVARTWTVTCDMCLKIMQEQNLTNNPPPEKEMNRLKGTGFVAVTPDSASFDGEEYATIEEAQEQAAELAHRYGSAIIYAPVTVVKPKRDVVNAVTSKLLTQLKLGKKSAE